MFGELFKDQQKSIEGIRENAVCEEMFEIGTLPNNDVQVVKFKIQIGDDTYPDTPILYIPDHNGRGKYRDSVLRFIKSLRSILIMFYSLEEEAEFNDKFNELVADVFNVQENDESGSFMETATPSELKELATSCSSLLPDDWADRSGKVVCAYRKPTDKWTHWIVSTAWKNGFDIGTFNEGRPLELRADFMKKYGLANLENRAPKNNPSSENSGLASLM